MTPHTSPSSQASALSIMNKLLDAVKYVEESSDCGENGDNGNKDDGGVVVYADDNMSEDVLCFVSLREKCNRKKAQCAREANRMYPSSIAEVTQESSRAFKRDFSCMMDDIDHGKKRRCLRTNLFGKLNINECSNGKRQYYNGFEKIINDGTVQTFFLGSQVYLLPSSLHEQMYIAQIESIYEEHGKTYINCHWFERLNNNEVQLTCNSDDNPIECIEGLCNILPYKDGKNLYCRGKYINGWFLN